MVYRGCEKNLKQLTKSPLPSKYLMDSTSPTQMSTEAQSDKLSKPRALQVPASNGKCWPAPSSITQEMALGQFLLVASSMT